MLGSLAVLLAGGAFYYQQFVDKPADQRSPEAITEEFLTAVLRHPNDLARTEALVCGGWTPDEALERVRREIPAGAEVGWQDIRLLSNTDGRARVAVTITLTPFQDETPSDFINWSVNLLQEGDEGWRVCEAKRVVDRVP